MLQEKIHRAVGFTMWSTCFFKFVPYEWDSEAFRFRKARLKHLILHYIVFGVEICITGFTWIRFGSMISRNFEQRPFIIAFIFALARGIEMVDFCLFTLRRNEIFTFGNAVFEAIDNAKCEKIKKQQESGIIHFNDQIIWDWSSVILVLSTFFVTINPPVHGMLLIETPCVPHFVSSIILDCKDDMDNNFDMGLIIPLIVLETFLMMSLLQGYTFLWTMIYIGCAWVQDEMEHAIQEAQSKVPSLRGKSRKRWRKVQYIIKVLNNAFWYYLIWSPSLTLAVTILLLFGIVRFREVDITNYLMFPACLGHCVFEGYSLLARSGRVNAESKIVLKLWKTSREQNKKYYRKFTRSCKPLMISAGDMYTFENSIVLTNINNCSSSALNLLVAYK